MVFCTSESERKVGFDPIANAIIESRVSLSNVLHGTYPSISMFHHEIRYDCDGRTDLIVKDDCHSHTLTIKNMNTNDTITSTCNALLRGELSAIETYNQAIEKFADTSGNSILESIRDDHETSANSLRDLIDECDEEPITSSGPWGVFASAVEGVAALFGESPALVILQHGEIHGIAEYEKALEDDELDESVKWLIRDELLPALRDHLIELERCKSRIIP